MTTEEITKLLQHAFVQAEIATEGDGSHFKVRIVSDDFIGMRPVKKQQMVYNVLNEHIRSGAIHALSIETHTQDEWQKARKLNLGQ